MNIELAQNRRRAWSLSGLGWATVLSLGLTGCTGGQESAVSRPNLSPVSSQYMRSPCSTTKLVNDASL